jgi:hypothetical protein
MGPSTLNKDQNYLYMNGEVRLPESKILPGNGRIFKNYKLQATNYKQIPNYNIQNYKQPYRA